MIKCSNCGTELKEDINFCEKCGTKINPNVESLPKTGHLLIRRNKSFYGCAIVLNIGINNNNYQFHNGDELNFDLLPGKYTITYKVWCRREKNVTIDVVEGGTYSIEFVNDYLWGGFKIGKNSKLN